MDDSKFLGPLVSVIMVSYKNLQYLDTCLKSIVSQSYNNIELIISNDGADEFDEYSVRDIVESKKTQNIRKVIVNKNERNLGTVKHCNVALGLASGTYIMFIACDDVYNNDDAVKDMVNGFSIVPSDVMAIAGQTGMYNSDLSRCMELFVKEETQKLINTLTPQEFYRNHLALGCLLPAASLIYKREVFEKYGKFDERYFLIEDYTSSVFYTRQGMRYYYLDIMCVNHRDGGVSHSALKPNSNVHKMYMLDTLLILKEILADQSLDKNVLEQVKQKRDWVKEQYLMLVAAPFLLPCRALFTKRNSIVFSLLSSFFSLVGLALFNIDFSNTTETAGCFFVFLGLLGFTITGVMITTRIVIKLYIYFGGKSYE